MSIKHVIRPLIPTPVVKAVRKAVLPSEKEPPFQTREEVQRFFDLGSFAKTEVFPDSYLIELANRAFQNAFVGGFYSELAHAFWMIGLLPEAARLFERAGQGSKARESLMHQITSLYGDPNATPKQIYDLTCSYAERFLPKPSVLRHKNLDPNRKLKVAYSCNYFDNTVSHKLFRPIFMSHRRSEITLYCYNDSEDTEEIKKVVDVWRNVKHLSNDQLLELIRSDEIDILIDLNGYTQDNRLPVLAKRAAPIQVSFQNYHSTLGLDAVDYILTGHDIADFSEAPYFKEKIFETNGTWSALDMGPLDEEPVVGPPPYLANGYITFGCFGAAHKVNPHMLGLWAKILHAVPDSRLYLKAGALSIEHNRNYYRDVLFGMGIARNRVYVEGPSEIMEMRRCYRRMDIALDTFPSNGGTTIVEALWAGVPVVSYFGQRLASRQGRYLLRTVDLKDLVADSPEKYIQIAVELAGNKERLSHLRSNLRSMMKSSDLANTKKYAIDVEDALRKMWRAYCENPRAKDHLDLGK